MSDLKNFNLFEWMELNRVRRFHYHYKKGQRSSWEFNDGLIIGKDGEVITRRNEARRVRQIFGLYQIQEFEDFLRSLEHEEILFSCYPDVGLKAIFGIHDSTLGIPLPHLYPEGAVPEKPSLGGCRFWNYSSFNEALDDSLRLQKGMTYKAAASGENLGGAKVVVWTHYPKYKNVALLDQIGHELNYLNGRIITGEDANCGVGDVERIAQISPFIAGRDESKRIKTTGGRGSGDPSSITAAGVIRGMKACLEFSGMGPHIFGKTVFVHGVGSVGYELCSRLRSRGVGKLMICDIDEFKIKKAMDAFNIPKENVIVPEKAYEVECDIYAPCLTHGGILNEDTIPRLKCKIICGSTNNQLTKPENGWLIFERGIVYGPDYVVNAGGLINVADELQKGGYNRNRVMEKVEKIRKRTLDVLMRSRKNNEPTNVSADKMAEARILAKRNRNIK